MRWFGWFRKKPQLTIDQKIEGMFGSWSPDQVTRFNEARPEELRAALNVQKSANRKQRLLNHRNR